MLVREKVFDLALAISLPDSKVRIGKPNLVYLVPFVVELLDRPGEVKDYLHEIRI